MSADCVLLPGLRHQQAAELIDRPGIAPPVDSYEVAAALEASGVSDRTALERYGQPDVFALGDDLLPELRSKAASVVVPPVAVRPPVAQTIHRGLVFVLPALLTGAVMGNRAAPDEVVLLLAAVAYGWAAGQGVAYAGYALIGTGSLPEARRLMRALAWLVLIPAAICAGVLWWQLPSARDVLAIALGQIVYVLASTIGVVLRRPGLMLLALVPGVAVAVPELLTDIAVPLVLPGVALSVVATVGVALWLCRGGHRPSWTVTRTILADSRLYAAYGACLALLITLGLVDGLVASPGTAGIGLTLAPLVGGVLVAEWQLEQYRSRATLAMRTSGSAAAFARAVRGALLRCVAGYLLVLVVLILLAAWWADGLQLVDLIRFVATGFLGWSFLVALLLVAHRQIVPVLVVAGAAVALAAGRYLLLDQAFELALGYLVICGSLATILSLLVWQRLPLVEVHR